MSEQLLRAAQCLREELAAADILRKDYPPIREFMDVLAKVEGESAQASQQVGAQRKMLSPRADAELANKMDEYQAACDCPEGQCQGHAGAARQPEAGEPRCGTATNADISTNEDSRPTANNADDSRELLSRPQKIATVRSASELDSVLNSPEPNVEVMPDGTCRAAPVGGLTAEQFERSEEYADMLKAGYPSDWYSFAEAYALQVLRSAERDFLKMNMPLLSKLPTFDLGWSEELKAKWFEIFHQMKDLGPTCDALKDKLAIYIDGALKKYETYESALREARAKALEEAAALAREIIGHGLVADRILALKAEDHTP